MTNKAFNLSCWTVPLTLQRGDASCPPAVQDSAATNHANIVTIGDYGTTASVQPLTGMNYPRAFSNSVVLPGRQGVDDGRSGETQGHRHGSTQSRVPGPGQVEGRVRAEN